MASKWRAIAVGGVVVAALMQAEHESPGATGRYSGGVGGCWGGWRRGDYRP